MERILDELYRSLFELVGLHRKLLDTVRIEHNVLVDVNVKAIQEATYSKEVLCNSIQQAESKRLGAIGKLAHELKRPPEDLPLSEVIIAVQGDQPKWAEKLRSIHNTLNLLLERIVDQNEKNKNLVESSLTHITAMKKNVLGEAAQKSETYTQSGGRSSQTNNARLISREV